ncbi:MAG TPA: DUF4854 domain-containing protein [Mogibacterium sp.]|nr:DUF4854 domain-containing protein [Mogibacterium sp.]
MKKKSLFSILAVAVLLISLVLTSCGEEDKTLESYVNSDKDLKEKIQQIGEDSGLGVEIKGNDVIYTFDIETLGVTKDMVDDNLKTELEKAQDTQKGTFVSVVDTLEEETEIDGIRIVINYTFQDEVLVNKIYEN